MVLSFSEYLINGIILLSLSIMQLRLIHVVCISISLLFMASWFSWDTCTAIYRFPFEGYLGCF